MSEFLKINQDLLSIGLRNIAGVYAVEIARTAEKVYQIDSDHLYTTSGLTKKQVLSEHSQIPCFHLFAMILNLVRTTQDETIGLQLGKNLELKAFYILGYVLMNCKNVREGIERTLRYERLATEVSLTTLEETENTVIVKWDVPYSDSEIRYFKELVLTGWVQLSRKIIAHEGSLELTAVYFSHSAPKVGPEPYEDFFGCPVHFDHAFTGVEFDQSILELPVSNRDPVLDRLMQQQADQMLEQLDDNVSFLYEARATIYRLMPSGDVSLDRLADEMRLSHKALYNRFKRAGKSFSDILDDVRRILSVAYLENPDINVLDVALLVGFTDQSSFSRAFKRWQKMSPGDYRKKVIKGESIYKGKNSVDTVFTSTPNHTSQNSNKSKETTDA